MKGVIPHVPPLQKSGFECRVTIPQRPSAARGMEERA